MKRVQRTTRKQKFKLPFSAILMYLSLLAVSLCGVTFSKYVTGTTVGDSARVAYMKELTITETGNFTTPNEWIIIPGVNMTKKATVHFEGSEMACYVFLEIKTDGFTRTGDYSFAGRIDGDDLISFQINKATDDSGNSDTDDTAADTGSDANTGWTFLSGDDDSAVYYCIVSANHELTADVLKNDGTITVSKQMTQAQLKALTNDRAALSIDIGATAVQYHGFSKEIETDDSKADRAEAVWNIVKSR